VIDLGRGGCHGFIPDILQETTQTFKEVSQAERIGNWLLGQQVKRAKYGCLDQFFY
jgi:hypothetical protein